MLWPSRDKDCLHHWLMGGGSDRSSLVVCVSSVTKSHPTLQPHGLWPSRLLCPWDSPGKNSGVCCHALLQGIFLPRLPMSPAEQEDSLPLWHRGSPSLVVCSSMSSKTHGYMYFRMIGRSTTRYIKKFCPELLNEYRATGVGCRILCVPGVVGSGVIRNSRVWAPLRWALRQAGVWWVVNQNLTMQWREEACGHPCVRGAWLDPAGVRLRRDVQQAPLSSGTWRYWSWAWRQYLASIWFRKGCRNDVWLMRSEHPLPSLHSPPASWPDLHAALRLSSDGRRGERRWSYRLPSPDTALCVCTGASLLEWIILLFSWCSSEGCSVYQERFLIT